MRPFTPITNSVARSMLIIADYFSPILLRNFDTSCSIIAFFLIGVEEGFGGIANVTKHLVLASSIIS